MMIQKHTHKLKQHRYSTGKKIYFCVLDCDFKIDPALVIGKKSICNKCGKEFIINGYSARLDRPHCENCHKVKKVKAIKQENNIDYKTINETETLAERLAKAVNEVPVFRDEEEEI